MIGAPGSSIGGMTGKTVLAKIVIVRGNNPAGQRHPVGQSMMKL